MGRCRRDCVDMNMLGACKNLDSRIFSSVVSPAGSSEEISTKLSALFVATIQSLLFVAPCFPRPMGSSNTNGFVALCFCYSKPQRRDPTLGELWRRLALEPASADLSHCCGAHKKAEIGPVGVFHRLLHLFGVFLCISSVFPGL